MKKGLGLWLAILLAMVLTVGALAEGLEIEYDESADLAVMAAQAPEEAEDADVASEAVELPVPEADEALPVGDGAEANDGFGVMAVSLGESVVIDETNFPDAYFREYVKKYDKDGNGALSEGERGAVDYIYIYVEDKEEIVSMKGIEWFQNLKKLTCRTTHLASLDISANTALEELACYQCNLPNIDIRGHKALRRLICWGNKFTTFDLTGCDKLIECVQTGWRELDDEGEPTVLCFEKDDCRISTDPGITITANGKTLFPVEKEKETDIIVNEISFPDRGIRQYIYDKIDTDHNWLLSESEIAAATEILYNYRFINYPILTDVKGIELFPALKVLFLGSYEENHLTSLDISANTALEELACHRCNLPNIDVRGHKALRRLICWGNKFTTFDLTGCDKLIECVQTGWHELDDEGEHTVLCFEKDDCRIVADLGITITANGKTLYDEHLSKAKVSVKAQTHTGKALKPAVKVTQGGRKLKNGTDYTVSYKNNKAVGTATVIVKGKEVYKGTVEASFTIKPKGTTLSSVTGGRKKLTVQWKAQTRQVSGYQIQYGTKKDFSNARTVTVNDAKAVKKGIKGLKAKKNYYVRIRTYKAVGGKEYYSSWSKSRKVKTE